jgi:hypothetical protein
MGSTLIDVLPIFLKFFFLLFNLYISMKKLITLVLVCCSLPLFAQQFTITSTCFGGARTLNQSGTLNGKPYYITAAAVSISHSSLGTISSKLECYWFSSANNWRIGAVTQPSDPMFISGNTGATPPTSIASWNNVDCNGGLTAIVLPIELTVFDVQNTEGGKNHLTWRTESEKDNSHFDIERSTDGSTFHSIGQVRGNNKPSSYQFVDNQPFAMTYYRLKQVDFDGTTTYSKVVSVEQKNKSKGLKVYPTLVSNGILSVDTEGVELRDFSITNLLGQPVLAGKTTQQLDVSRLSQGTYVLKVGTEVAKFVKQ